MFNTFLIHHGYKRSRILIVPRVRVPSTSKQLNNDSNDDSQQQQQQQQQRARKGREQEAGSREHSSSDTGCGNQFKTDDAAPPAD